MRKLGIIAVLSLMALALAAVPAIAAGSPHFIKSATNASVDQSGNLVVNFKEAGLSNGSIETITLSGTGTADYQCFNNGGKHPRAANKETVRAESSSTGQFTVQNGNVTGTLSAPAARPGRLQLPFGPDPGRSHQR